MENNLYKIAAINGYRFINPNPKSGGELTIDQLFSLEESALKSMANSLNRLVKDTSDDLFNEKANKLGEHLKNKLDIVLDVLKHKANVENEAQVKRAKIEAKSKILEALAQKKDESLKAMSIEDLEKLLNSL